MIEDLALYLLPAGAIAAFLGTIALRGPHPLALKVLGVLAVGSFVPIAHESLVGLLGLPKPVALERNMADNGRATVLASRMKEGEAIWLWLAFEDSPEPRAFALPWDEDTAKQLRKAQSEGARDGAAVEMRVAVPDATEGHDDTQLEPMFYPAPVAALPEKPVTDAG